MGKNIRFRMATEKDLDAIVAMLADDVLGSKRERYEHPLPTSYIRYSTAGVDALITLPAAHF